MRILNKSISENIQAELINLMIKLKRTSAGLFPVICRYDLFKSKYAIVHRTRVQDLLIWLLQGSRERTIKIQLQYKSFPRKKISVFFMALRKRSIGQTSNITATYNETTRPNALVFAPTFWPQKCTLSIHPPNCSIALNNGWNGTRLPMFYQTPF